MIWPILEIQGGLSLQPVDPTLPERLIRLFVSEPATPSKPIACLLLFFNHQPIMTPNPPGGVFNDMCCFYLLRFRRFAVRPNCSLDARAAI